jgi:carboxypeptidase PM20D1
MCKHAMCEHGQAGQGGAVAHGPSPIGLASACSTLLLGLVSLAAVVYLGVYVLPWQGVLGIVLLFVAHLAHRALRADSSCAQLDARALASLAADESHQRFMRHARTEAERLARAERFGQAIRLQTVSYDPVAQDSAAASATAVPSTAAAASPPPQGPRTDYNEFLKLHAVLEQNYPLVHRHLERTVINKYSLVFRWRAKKHSGGDRQPKKKPILLTAHLDVVPAGDGHLWDQEAGGPFSGRLITVNSGDNSGSPKKSQQWICGRGAIDDKQAVIGLMEAIESLLAEGVLFPPTGAEEGRDVFLAFGHDEEIGGHEGAKHIAAHFTKIFKEEQGEGEEGDAEAVEKGGDGLRRRRDAGAHRAASSSPRPSSRPFSFLLDEGLFVVSSMLPGVDCPVAMVCVAEKGYLLEELSVSVSAEQAGHASAPARESAIGILAGALARIERARWPTYLAPASPVRLMFESVASHARWPMRLLFANLHVFSPVLRLILAAKHTSATLVRTTTALTVFIAGSKGNVLPREARAIINHRIHPADSVEGVLRFDAAAAADERVRIRELSSLRPSSISSSGVRSFGYRTIQRALGRVLPDALVAPALMVGNTDTHHYWSLSDDIYRFSPTRRDPTTITQFHGANERIELDNFIETVAFYRALIHLAGEDATDTQ